NLEEAVEEKEALGVVAGEIQGPVHVGGLVRAEKFPFADDFDHFEGLGRVVLGQFEDKVKPGYLVFMAIILPMRLRLIRMAPPKFMGVAGLAGKNKFGQGQLLQNLA